MNPKHQYHLSQWGESVYGAKSWKERRLLCESMFTQIQKWTLILKVVISEVFSYQTKASISLSQWGDCVCGA